MSKYIVHDHNPDGIDRRGFLKCMAWAGTGALWVVQGGVLKSFALEDAAGGSTAELQGELSFVQISDSHIGFNKPANPDVVGTLREAIAKINALPVRPQFALHTGDLTHLCKPAEFDTLEQELKALRTGRIFYVPGEHDVLEDDGRQFRERFGQGTSGAGWYSFEQQGVHFIGLVNVVNLKAGGLGNLGTEQLEWLEDDVGHLKSSTPIVVFAHIPLWSVYPEWGWGTDDGARALSYLKRFGSVTVLNGHIHQTMQKIEGHVTFHTAASTAFPQPAPGTAPSPGPLNVPAEQLRGLLGLTDLKFVRGRHSLAIVDSSLADGGTGSAPAAPAPQDQALQVTIENFSFAPSTLTVPAGTKVTWVNRDDEPHIVVSAEGKFKSGVLDTEQQFSLTFADAGTHDYYCSLHPRMVAKVVVK